MADPEKSDSLQSLLGHLIDQEPEEEEDTQPTVEHYPVTFVYPDNEEDSE